MKKIISLFLVLTLCLFTGSSISYADNQGNISPYTEGLSSDFYGTYVIAQGANQEVHYNPGYNQGPFTKKLEFVINESTRPESFIWTLTEYNERVSSVVSAISNDPNHIQFMSDNSFTFSTTIEGETANHHGGNQPVTAQYNINFHKNTDGSVFADFIVYKFGDSSDRIFTTELVRLEDYNSLNRSTSFAQKVITDNGEYEMFISGFINTNAPSGTTILTASEISKQNISIHLQNTFTGEIRTMTQSTIEGLTLNVSTGAVRSITLQGRVQTLNGSLQRYTTTVNL